MKFPLSTIWVDNDDIISIIFSQGNIVEFQTNVFK